MLCKKILESELIACSNMFETLHVIARRNNKNNNNPGNKL